MIYTTPARIRERSPCEDGWEKLCKSLGGIEKYGKDTPVSLLKILDSNGLDDALWCLRACDAETFAREFARWCALQVVHLWEPPAVVLEYLSTGNETLRDAARDAAWPAAWSVAGAAGAARAAAWPAAWSAAWSAAGAARAAAGNAAWDARAAGDAAWDAAWDAQTQHLRDMLEAYKEKVA